MIIIPMVCPLSFLLRRAASRPTRKTTESRRLLTSEHVVSLDGGSRMVEYVIKEQGGYTPSCGTSVTVLAAISIMVGISLKESERTPAVPYWNVNPG